MATRHVPLVALAALVFSLAGDVLLMLPTDRFVARVVCSRARWSTLPPAEPDAPTAAAGAVRTA